MSPGGGLLPLSGPEDVRKGLVLLPEGPMLVTSRPILSSSKQGPVRGTLICARPFDEKEVKRLSRYTLLPLVFKPMGGDLPSDFAEARDSLKGGISVYSRVADEKTVSGFTAIEDLAGKPVLLMKADLPRDMSKKQEQAGLLYFLVSFLEIGLIFSRPSWCFSRGSF